MHPSDAFYHITMHQCDIIGSTFYQRHHFRSVQTERHCRQQNKFDSSTEFYFLSIETIVGKG